MAPPRPKFSDLPIDKNGPPGNAWGLYGPNDELGTLNMLTPETVTAASKEIKAGIRVSLDLPLNFPKTAMFGREGFTHKIISKAPRAVNDDEVSFNTQCSTQWDGLRHYGYSDEKKWYLGRERKDFESSGVLGIDVIVANGGIVGRGILLDYADWAAEQGIKYNPLDRHSIPTSALQQIMSEKGIEARPGDILFVRSGFTAAYLALSPEEEVKVTSRELLEFIGVEVSEDMLRFIWENGFSAVAGDSTSFELSPSTNPSSNPKWRLHHWLLAGWGMPIGELFNLEDLSRECKRLNRYTFFLSSMPLRVPGGVASPPNAVAIF